MIMGMAALAAAVAVQSQELTPAQSRGVDEYLVRLHAVSDAHGAALSGVGAWDAALAEAGAAGSPLAPEVLDAIRAARAAVRTAGDVDALAPPRPKGAIDGVTLLETKRSLRAHSETMGTTLDQMIEEAGRLGQKGRRGRKAAAAAQRVDADAQRAAANMRLVGLDIAFRISGYLDPRRDLLEAQKQVERYVADAYDVLDRMGDEEAEVFTYDAETLARRREGIERRLRTVRDKHEEIEALYAELDPELDALVGTQGRAVADTLRSAIETEEAILAVFDAMPDATAGPGGTPERRAAAGAFLASSGPTVWPLLGRRTALLGRMRTEQLRLSDAFERADDVF